MDERRAAVTRSSEVDFVKGPAAEIFPPVSSFLASRKEALTEGLERTFDSERHLLFLKGCIHSFTQCWLSAETNSFLYFVVKSFHHINSVYLI